MSMPDPAAEGAPLVLSETVSLKSFLGLSLRNGLLNLVTLTLYRFWGKTEVRRRLWRSIELNGEPFEYTGRGIELFLGFVIALGVIVLPFLLVVFGAQLLGPVVAVLVILPFYVFMGVLAGYGRFTAFRYLASRSTWRGVRFWLKGSPLSYGFRWLGYSFLAGFTLGWFWPAAQRRLAMPLWDGLRFGDRRFRFSRDQAREEGVYNAFALGWVGGVVAYFVLVGIFATVLAPSMTTNTPAEPSLGQIAMIYLVTGVMAVLFIVLLAPYHAAMLRSIARGVSFEEVRFRLNVRWLELAGMTLSNVGLVTFSLGFLMPFAEARAARFLVRRLTAEGAVDLDSVRQSPDMPPRTGEGLADAFGFSPV
jgi:uncharacterized membrane protein YjgN (DUF898 family)